MRSTLARFTTKAAGTALALACAFGLASTAAHAQQGVTPTEILIGGFGPLTGPLSWLGQGSRDGTQLAVDEINANGGINGRKLRFVHQPAASPAESLAAVKKLHEQQKVYAVFSGSGSTGAEAAADYFREMGMPVMNPVSITMKMREPFTKNVFNGAPPAANQLNDHNVKSILAANPAAKNIAVLVGTYAFPQAEWNATKPALEKAGVKFTTVQTYDLGDKDYTAQIVAIARSKPDLVVFFGQVQEGALAVKQAKERGAASAPWWVGAGVVTRSFPTVAGAAADGVRSVWLLPYYHGEKAPDNAKFETAWIKRFGTPPEGRPAYTDVMGYGDMYVLALAMKKAGNDLSWANLIRQMETLKEAKPSDFGPWAADVIFPETYGPTQRQGNNRTVNVIVKDGTWQVLR
ncbi:ABC transporter substrate-binding protein [Caenimonas soli]|uniref:ABC transporter substrate-binding protein n=1 Tax=Caenimonas soli TaxID=2735555 RepID=UPI001551D10A|nr:ABC transporter substrate-binding protein [Caenimonas soli]NPC58244.1 ABC transporter substrate-binding protein [Caenimonas soli]